MRQGKEITFEAEICAHLAAHGWLHAEGDAAQYDRTLALFPADVLAWVQASQPKNWGTLVKNHGAKAGETLLALLRDQREQRGTLDLLRHGVELLGLKRPLMLAQFKPACGMTPDILARYAANRLRVVRQVRYSTQNENALDLVLFLNGLPVATAELTTDSTQNVRDAIDQYRFDRLPWSKRQPPETLLTFPSGALVHFAISNREVQMTTRLAGTKTAFYPFTRGENCAAGNPAIPDSGHCTAYLWEKVWEKESWLQILGQYLIVQRNKKRQITKILFPRHHQIDITRKLQAAVLKDGAGSTYLVQHAAGSGRTNSIAWAAHFLAELHDAADQKVFDTVLVASDRNVIDVQLHEALFDFARTAGAVATIRGRNSTRSVALAEVLSGKKKVVVCTIRTFPFVLEAARKLAATRGKRFAVIADGAHSAQTGEAAATQKAVLSPEELAELWDGGEVKSEDIIAAQMAVRHEDQGITFVVFTATPKNEPLEFFGTRPDLSRRPALDHLPVPFHGQSTRRAIEEELFLDVPKNCTPYKLAAHRGAKIDDQNVQRSAARKRRMGRLKLDPYNIAQKIEGVVDHLWEGIAPLLRGRAMVGISGRVEAVRWQLAIDKFIKERDHQTGSLVALSGEVNDQEQDPVLGALEGRADAPAVHVGLRDLAFLGECVRAGLKQYRDAHERLKSARQRSDAKEVRAAEAALNALILCRTDMGAFVRMYTFLSQVFDYGTTAVEKRAISFGRRIPLVKLGREMGGIDLSKVVPTLRKLRNLGKRIPGLASGKTPKLAPTPEAGIGSVQERQAACTRDLIEKVNNLFEGELIDQDKLNYVNNVIKGKLLESVTLRTQATRNTKEQFANSPDLKTELQKAIIGAMDAHTLMSTQALNSSEVQSRLKDILLNHAGLYENLRDHAAT